MSNQISIAQARSLFLGEQVNEIRDKRKANIFFNVNDKAASSANRISIKEERSVLSEF
jgi:hypothetical protein